MNTQKKILIVSPDKSRLRYISNILYKSNYSVNEVMDYSIAYQKILLETPDSIFIDVFSNYLSGLELISKIRKVNKSLIIFAFVDIGSPEICNKVMSYGANRYFIPPYYSDVLLKSLELEFSESPERKSRQRASASFVATGIVASTGGPITLENIISKLEFTNKAAFFIVLHAPAWMLENYTERLNQTTKYNVHLAQEGMKIKPGNIYFAPGNFHMIVDSQQIIKLNQNPPVNFVRPSADPLFESIAKVFKNSSIGVVLTGMGHDGTSGAAHIKKSGGTIIVQSPDSAVIHAMPLAVINAGLADKTVPLDDLHKELIKEIESFPLLPSRK